MNRYCGICLMTCFLFIGAIGSAHGKGGTALSSLVPYEAAGVVVVNHHQLSTHPAYANIKKLLGDQHAAKGFLALSEVQSIEPSTIQQVLVFRVPGQGEGTLIRPNIGMEKLRQHAQAQLGNGFSEGRAGDDPWLTLTSHLRIRLLVAPGVLVIGPQSIVEQVAQVAAGKKKAFDERRSFPAMKRAAAQGNPLVWGVSFISKAQRRHFLERGIGDISKVARSYFRVAGNEAVDVKVVAFTADGAAAKQVADAIFDTIRRRIIGTTWMKLLGIAAVAKRISVTAEGSQVVAGLQLTAGQVGLIAQSGSRLIAALRP